MPKGDIGLPVREFFYTIDQVAFLLSADEAYVKRSLIHYEGRSVGVCPKDKMIAYDISPDNSPKPEWRVPEKSLKRWMRFKGIKVYDAAYAKHPR